MNNRNQISNALFFVSFLCALYAMWCFFRVWQIGRKMKKLSAESIQWRFDTAADLERMLERGRHKRTPEANANLEGIITHLRS